MDVVVYWGFADVGTDKIVVLLGVGVFEFEEMTLYPSHCCISEDSLTA